MKTKITPDSRTPTVSVEMMIEQPLEDYDLTEVEADTPRDVDPMLASQGFKDLLDDARAILEKALIGHGLKIVQLTGAICHDHKVHRPGIWLVVEEKGRASGEVSSEAQANIATAVESMRSGLGLL